MVDVSAWRSVTSCVSPRRILSTTPVDSIKIAQLEKQALPSHRHHRCHASCARAAPREARHNRGASVPQSNGVGSLSNLQRYRRQQRQLRRGQRIGCQCRHDGLCGGSGRGPRQCRQLQLIDGDLHATDGVPAAQTVTAAEARVRKARAPLRAHLQPATT